MTLIAPKVRIYAFAFIAEFFYYALAAAITIIIVTLFGVENIVANAVAAIAFVRTFWWR